MKLYNLTLHPTATSVYAINGNFLGTNGSQEIVVAQGGIFSLLRPDTSGQLKTLHSYIEHSPVCSLARLNRSKKDRVLVVFNFVKVLVLGYTNPEDPKIEKYYELNSIDPIHFLTSDPYGKVFMSARRQAKIPSIEIEIELGKRESRETTKLICTEAGKIPSIEIELGPTMPCSIAALHVWESLPVVAAIVPDTSGAPIKYISYYMANFTANRFVEIDTCKVDNEVNLVIAVPGGRNGPGGVLLCARNKIIYKKMFSDDDVTVDIPLICGFPWEQGYYVISATTYQKNSFILQMESGDVFEATLICKGKGNSVSEIKIKYIDTIPATSAICALEEGFLFMGSKSGNHALYQVRQKREMVDIGSSYVLRGPRGLKNLVGMDYRKRFTQMRAMKVSSSKEESIQAVSLQGSSSMKTMRLLVATKWSSVVRPPYRAPDAVWTVKTNANDRFDTYVVMSFQDSDSTHVFLMNGELAPGNVRVIGTTSSLAVCTFGNNSILQVHRRGVRHIEISDGTFAEYEVPRDIVKVAYNRYQVVIAVCGGELRYYRLGPTNRLQFEGRHEMPLEVACLSIPDPRAEVMAVCLYDNRVRILCLSPLDLLWFVTAEETVPSQPESLLFLFDPNTSVAQPNSLFLNVGLKNGVLIRRLITESSELFSLPSKYLGSRPPKLYAITVNGHPAILCLSSRVWLGYNHNGRFLLTPLHCEALETVASYSSALWEEGVIAVFGGKVGVFTFKCMGDSFIEDTPNLRCTTRKFMLQQEDPFPLSRTIVRGTWLGESYKLELKDNEAAFSACDMNFHSTVGYGPLLVIGTDFRDSSTAGSIHIYRFLEGKLLELLPSMQLEGVPQALCHFGGRLLLAGIGPVLRMYDCLDSGLHKRCEIELFPKSRTIVSVQVHRNIVFVGDSQEAVHRFEYRIAENKLYAFEYANVPRRLAASLHIDSDIMVGADEFGNVFFVQFPTEVEEDPTSTTRMLRGVPKEVNEIVHFRVGDVVTCLMKSSIREKDEFILYGTDTGNLGAFLSLSMEDADFFLQLEMCMRREYPPLCHWDRDTDQSVCTRVIDGDLCEQFETVSPYSQKKIAIELGSTVVEILRKMGDIKSRII